MNRDQIMMRRCDDRADVDIIVAFTLCVQEVVAYGAIDHTLPVFLDENITVRKVNIWLAESSRLRFLKQAVNLP